MSEQESIIINNEVVEELPEPQIEAPIKIKKPMSSERLDQFKKSKSKNTRKVTRNEGIKN